jgi:hypothetical protein
MSASIGKKEVPEEVVKSLESVETVLAVSETTGSAWIGPR